MFVKVDLGNSKIENYEPANMMYKMLTDENYNFSISKDSSLLPNIYLTIGQILGKQKKFNEVVEITSKGISHCIKYEISFALASLFLLNSYALLDLGNLSGIGKEIGEKQNFNDFTSQNSDWCLAYGRDRGQKDQEASLTESEEEYLKDGDYPYIYLYKNGEWSFKDMNQDRYSGLQTISSALNIKEEEENE